MGRWSLLGAGSPASPTERLVAQARQLLARHGILTREAMVHESVPGGFGALYPVLSLLEEQGHVRRGYFVAGLGGSQFADPGAVEKLRLMRESGSVAEGCVVLAATDPANPYGAALSWPEPAGRFARLPHTHVALVDGALVGYLTRGGRQLDCLLPDEEPRRFRVGKALACGLAAWARRTGRVALGWGAMDEQARRSMAPYLVEEGFAPSGAGFRLRVLPGTSSPGSGLPED